MKYAFVAEQLRVSHLTKLNKVQHTTNFYNNVVIFH